MESPNPPHAEARKQLELGWTLFISGLYSDAREYFLKAIQLSPEDSQAHLLLGQTYFFQEKPALAEAAREFRQVVSLSPDWAEGHRWLGTAQEKQGQLREATISFERAIALAPQDTRPRISLGACLTELGNYAGAIIHLREGIALKPHYAEASAHLFLAEALMRSGQIEEACKEWRIILGMPAEYPDHDNPHKEARQLLKRYCG